MAKDQLRTRRNAYEYALCERLHRALPDDKRITLLADRGFGDQKLYAFLEALGWDYVIRFRASIPVTPADGPPQKARELVGPAGRTRKLLRGTRHGTEGRRAGGGAGARKRHEGGVVLGHDAGGPDGPVGCTAGWKTLLD